MKKMILAIALATVACKTDKPSKPDAKPPTGSATKINKQPRPSSPGRVMPTIAPNVDGVESRSVITKEDEAYLETAFAEESAIVGHISTRDWNKYWFPSAEAYQSSVDENFADLYQCKLDMISRNIVIDSRYEWSLGLHIIGDGEKIRTVAVTVPESFWPPIFDDEAKRCFRSFFEKRESQSRLKLDMLVEFQMCINPPVQGESQ